MATSAYQKQYKARGKKARAVLAKADRNSRKRLGQVAAAQQRLNDALARLARLNQVYSTAYPEQTDLSADFDDYGAGAAQLAGAYPVAGALPALAVVAEASGGLALAGEAIFGEAVTGPPPAPLRLTGAALRGVNPTDGGFTVLEGQVTATGGTGAVAVRITIDNFVDGGTHQIGEPFSYPLSTRFVTGVRQYRAEVVGQPGVFVTDSFTVE
ncbi:hypothetical protein [Hymenobacter nivis]|uniref:Uncharacterized protein n=1 Tax=Hymenobacter nivis TaxID=1850093 RepID=A0A2Z3GKA4_9BACT|nr:hypothetical protein [Hymenobacter nivis]AWM32472.1 hypothetical protein DDQ68_06515 [Hymenobacter nivis]